MVSGSGAVDEAPHACRIGIASRAVTAVSKSKRPYAVMTNEDHASDVIVIVIV